MKKLPRDRAEAVSLPARGVAAHRGGAGEQPENTLAAFENAARSGVHQIELDVRRSRDGALVVMHDETVDRTTNGVGRVRDLSLAGLRCLDAGSVASRQSVPTLAEVLDAMPRDVWINVQIKRGEPVPEAVAELILERDRASQAFVAGGNDACRRVRSVDPSLRICNLVRQRTRAEYVEHAVREQASFIQFHHLRGAMEPELARLAHAAGMRVNFMCSPNPSPGGLQSLFEAGVDFVLVDDLDPALGVGRRLGIPPLERPAFRERR